ncbi:hypothetical protein DFJ77DRAFT_75455 [Powellomyces hirtus]|nr:hypothetical protein DFJ77DRAFT_75455 [Powellomyces hirtus]
MLTGQIHKIYSLSGQRQQTVEDLVHGGGYVVVPNNDSFIHARYNTNALNTRHSYHHGAAKDGTGTDGGSSDVPTRRVRKLRKRRKQTASASEDEAGEKVQRRIMHRRETGGRLKEEEEHEADTGYQTDVTTIVKKGVVKKKPAVTALTAPDPTPPPAPAPSTVKAIAHAQMLTPGAAPPPRPQQVPVKREVDEPVYDDLHRRIQPTTTTTTIVTASQPVYGPQTHDEAGWVQSQPRLDASSIVKQYIEPQREVQHHGEPPAKKEQKEEAESRGLKGKKQPQQQTQPLPIPPIPAEPMPTEQPQHEIVDSSGGSWYVSPTAQRSDNTQPAADIGTVRITDSEETGEPGEPQGYFTKGGKWLQGQAPQQQQLQQEVQSPQTEESGFTFVKKSNAEGYFTKGTKKPAQQQPSSGGGGGIISKTIRKTKQGDTTTEIDEEVLETPDEMVATQRIVVHGDANDMYGESSQIRVLKSTAQQEQQQQSSYSSSPTATRHGKGEEEKDEEEEKETEENEYETVVTTTTAPARGKRRTLLPGLPRKKTNS